MKVLLDENLPRDLRHFLSMHETFTVAYMGWAGVENGDLLSRAAAEQFDVFVTKDAGIRYEQNLPMLPLTVVMLKAKSNAIDDIRPLVSKLVASLDALASTGRAAPKSIVRIE